MNYIGKKVIHKAFGPGVIVGQDQSSHITVRFDAAAQTKTFVHPACFQTFLKLLDGDAAKAAAEEHRANEAQAAAQRAQAERERQQRVFERRVQANADRGTSGKRVAVPAWATADEFYEQQERLLIGEIAWLRQNGGKRQKIVDGAHIETRKGVHLYSFESESELNLPDNSPITLWQGAESTSATVVSCEDFTLIIATSTWLGESVASIEFSSEPWRLLSYLIERMKVLRQKDSPIARALICDGRKKVQFDRKVRTGQETACNMSLEQPITFVWGPPGTGKTETLAKIALAHMSRGLRVLMLSYSNVSVDGAILRVFERSGDHKRGVMLRYGYPRDKGLLGHEYLTAYACALSNHPELAREREELILERKHAPRTSTRYVQAGNMLARIKKTLQEEEKRAVSDARFVATTVSKAIADKVLYEDRFDTVIFDEASMAFIPQIVFSAGLADKHFVCMGDFAQLPPIVQGDDESALNVDIFRHCGIVDAVEAGYGHEWLCMLDTQYRMHPMIADFSGRTMYRGLLRSAPDMLKKRQPIAKLAPLAGQPMGVVDLSGMMSVCTRTADQSRINVLSAMIAMGLALQAARKCEVGVITPYSAQSRLMHAMARDIAERHPKLHRITCATVHQFQGSEKDVIVYDAVDCYRMPYPGTLLTSMTNNYANRLYNVALTRARGKMISVVNEAYMRTKNLSQNLIFRRMLDETGAEATLRGNAAVESCDGEGMAAATSVGLDEAFMMDVDGAKQEIRIEIPGSVRCDAAWLSSFSQRLREMKRNGISVTVRAESKLDLPPELRDLAIENPFVTNPIAMIDRQITWFGKPHSRACFVAEGSTIPTRFRPILRFEGKHFAQAVYGFLEMDRTLDQATAEAAKNSSGGYDTFSAYVGGELTCPVCRKPMQLKKGKSGRFFLGCTGYPQCDHTEWVTEDMVDDYFYFKNRDGKRCPHDNTSLEPCVGRYGLYIRCNALRQHTFKLTEI
ncbi:MAG: topoisomerase DNA-binding C4 zinc finger domain-containing protein [Clostridia bacterium]|nr:topoisomerase DNA-binding C4 zinc finger domain-containing protein [Clostridia bacterium]